MLYRKAQTVLAKLCCCFSKAQASGRSDGVTIADDVGPSRKHTEKTGRTVGNYPETCGK